MKKIILYLIFMLAIFVRVYNSLHFPSYSAEIARHYLEIKKPTEGTLILNGPLTSHPWLRLGATPYYLFFPILYIARFHPLTLFYFWTLIDIIMIFINYYVVKKLFNEKTALLSTLFLSISPLHLTFNRVPGFYSFIIPFIYVLLFYLNKVIRKKSTPFWPIFLIIGFMINLHAAAFFLIPLCIFWGIVLKRFSKITIIQSVIAFLIPNIPFLINDFLRQFNSILHLSEWIPYKIFNFVSGKTLGMNRTITNDTTLFDVINFFKTNFLPPYFSTIFGLLIIVILIWYFFVKRRSALIYVIYLWLFFGITALIIHKNPPIHYFVPVFILPILLISYMFAYLLESKKIRLISLVIIVFIVISNFSFIFSSSYLFQKQKNDPFNIPYKTQEKVAKFIMQDAKGRKFTLFRIGPFDNYANQFKENYEYLLWWLGNEPVKKSSAQYTIVEDKNRVLQSNVKSQLMQIDGIVVVKSVK